MVQDDRDRLQSQVDQLKNNKDEWQGQGSALKQQVEDLLRQRESNLFDLNKLQELVAKL